MLLVIQNAASGYKVIGVGKVVNIQSQYPVDKVAVLVISIEPDAKNIGLRINQTILWPRRLIAISNVHSNKETISNTNKASNQNERCESSTENAHEDFLIMLPSASNLVLC